MKKYTGGMMAYLNDKTVNSAENNVKIEMIDFRNLIPNEKNFYGMREIEELAHSMALSGNVTPLLVVPRDDGKYKIISGERRYRAVKLRFERNEIVNPNVPCQIHEAFKDDDNGKISAEMRENIAIICANNYREKSALEKLQEIKILEPIARIYYEEKKEEGQAFRAYFAENFLGISDSSLRRLLSLRKLTEESRTALEDGRVSDSLAFWLASRTPEQQHKYLTELKNGVVNGTVREAKQLEAEAESETEDESEDTAVDVEDDNDSASDDDNTDDEPEKSTYTFDNPESSSETEDDSDEDDVDDSEESESASEPDENQEELFDTPIPENLSPENAEKEAMGWVTSCLQDIASMAEQKAVVARREGKDKEAAQWELRKAAVNLAIETIK